SGISPMTDHDFGARVPKGRQSPADSAAAAVLEGRSSRRGISRILPFLGPAFVACVAYIDPGNFATNIAGGAQYGYLLLWVVIASNLTAMLVQALSAKLGIATGRNLAEVCRDRFPRPVVCGNGERAPGHRHPGGHRDAARRLLAFGPDATPHCAAQRGAGEAALPFRGHRRGTGDGAGGCRECRNADHGGLHVLYACADAHRQHRSSAPNPGAAAGPGHEPA